MVKTLFKLKANQTKKSRLVVQGIQHHQNLKTKNFSPVISFDTLLFIIVLTKYLNFKISILDVTGAFLQSKFTDEENIYIFVPKGYNETNTTLFKLNLPLYGLPRSPKDFYMTIKNFLLSLKFNISSHDLCLFYKLENGSLIYVTTVHVDDLYLASSIR